MESLSWPSKPDTARPTQLTSTGRGCSHQPGHPSQDFHISSAGASRTRAITTGSPALYQLSYGTGILTASGVLTYLLKSFVETMHG